MREYILAFRRTFDFKGRSSRKEYWCFFGINWAVYFILTFFIVLADGDPDFGFLGVILLLYYIAAIIPMISLAVRRVHDTNRQWYYLLIPYFNIVLMFLPGDKQENNFGNVPDINRKHISNTNYSQALNTYNTNVSCPYCGSSIVKNVNFCSNCGKSIQNKSQNKICPNCHKQYPADTIYCEECGTKLK